MNTRDGISNIFLTAGYYGTVTGVLGMAFTGASFGVGLAAQVYGISFADTLSNVGAVGYVLSSAFAALSLGVQRVGGMLKQDRPTAKHRTHYTRYLERPNDRIIK